MAKEKTISFRLCAATEKRLMDMIAATGSEITRSRLIETALLEFMDMVERHPCLLPGYDKKLDRSVAQKDKRRDKSRACAALAKDV